MQQNVTSRPFCCVVRFVWCPRTWRASVCGIRSTPSALSWASRTTSCPRPRARQTRNSPPVWRTGQRSRLEPQKRPRGPATKRVGHRGPRTSRRRYTCLGGLGARKRNGSRSFCRPPDSKQRRPRRPQASPWTRVVSAAPSTRQTTTLSNPAVYIYVAVIQFRQRMVCV